MGYSFMTFEKIKTVNVMVGKYNHNYREMMVPNADPNLAELNDELVSLNGKTYKQAFNDKLTSLGYGPAGKTIRKNAVLALEVVTTFSSEDKEYIDLEKWKKNNVKWLKEAFNVNPEAYGDNVLSVMYHGDESGNVHCHAFVVPIDDKGNLNARYYISNRTKLIELQNSYGDLMRKEHGLQRGLPNSKATHKDIKRYYAALNNTLESELPEVKENESAKEYRARCNELYIDMKLKNMGLQEKMKQSDLAYNQRIKNLTSEIRKEFYQKNEKVLTQAEEIEREFGSMEDCAIKAMEYKNLELGISLQDDSGDYMDLIRRLAEIGKEEKKKRTPHFEEDR